jgi:hypothetical protein
MTKKHIYFIVAFLMMTSFQSCKDDNEGTPESNAAKSLLGTWRINGGGQVIVDNADHTADYTNMSITFNETDNGQYIYTVTSGNNAFKDITMDSWSFTDSNYSVITRGQDGVAMSFSLQDNKLTLNFTISDPQSGRVNGMFGDFKIVLVKG